jgi:hypothetical protein
MLPRCRIAGLHITLIVLAHFLVTIALLAVTDYSALIAVTMLMT